MVKEVYGKKLKRRMSCGKTDGEVEVEDVS
jgi:hypothetical protein